MNARSRLIRISLATCLLLGSLVVVGCRSDQRDAANTTAEFVEAMKGGNQAGFTSLLTRAGKERWNQSISDQAGKKGQSEEYSIGDAVVVDDKASVPVTIKDSKGVTETETIKLRREDGSWKVYAMVIPAGSVMVTMDFEHPEAFMTDMMRAAGEQMGEGFKALGKGIQAFGEGFKNGFGNSSTQASTTGH